MKDALRALRSEIRAAADIIRHHRDALQKQNEDTPLEKHAAPVLLLHGYLVGAPSLRGQERYLRKQGFAAFSVPYAFWEDLRKVRKSLEPTLEALCQQYGKKVAIVGHSEGGLVSYSLAQQQPESIDRIIALGTPFHGTWAAYLNPFVESARQMLPKSEYLRELHDNDSPSVPVVSIYSRYDELVIPWQSALLSREKHVYNIEATSVGHGGLITRFCYPLVQKWLEKDFNTRKDVSL